MLFYFHKFATIKSFEAPSKSPSLHAMRFHPCKHQYEATFLGQEDESALLNIKQGTLSDHLRIPLKLVPPEIQVGETFILNFQSQETAKEGETETLKHLLKELIQ